MEDRPTIIGSGHGHTVSLPEGSSVASHRRAPQVGSKLPEDLPVAQRTGDEPPPVPAGRPGGTRPPVPTSPSPAPGPGAGLATAPVDTGLDDALMARLSELARRNDAVRATLDRVAPPRPTAS